MEIYSYHGLSHSILFPIKVHTISILWSSMDFKFFSSGVCFTQCFMCPLSFNLGPFSNLILTNKAQLGWNCILAACCEELDGLETLLRKNGILDFDGCAVGSWSIFIFLSTELFVCIQDTGMNELQNYNCTLFQ